MTEETDRLDGQDEAPDAVEHPEISAIVESLEPEGEPEPSHDAVEAPTEIAEEASPEAPAEPEADADGEPEAQTGADADGEPEAPSEEPAAALEAGGSVSSPDAVSWWPFVAYLALWVVFAGVVIWRFYDIPQGQAVYESPLYPLSVFGGIALTVAGPLLSLATWVAAWGAPGSSKWGQFVSSLVKGSAVTAGGVVLWWIALVIVDQLRLGRVF